ncbi:MAG: DUF1559 domain-containing protein [Planctomycetota bacterium]|nr:MAG: DUF1559 domain-containing protein [Planctomycetota bacterium]
MSPKDRGVPMLHNRTAGSHRTTERSGLTLLEVLVTIVVLILLMALILPGLNGTRVNSRRAECLNNMRWVAIAFQTYATANNGDLPMLHQADLENDADPGNTPHRAGWPFELLPYLEEQGLYDRLTTVDAATNSDPNNADTFHSLTSNINLRVYTCPDSDKDEQGGALSFVVNMGYMTADIWDDPGQTYRHQVSGTYDWNNGDFAADSFEDEQLSRASGAVLFDHEGVPTSLNRIPDGVSSTILLTENLDAGSWISGVPHDIGFAVRIDGTTAAIPTAEDGGIGSDTQQTALQLPAPVAFDLGPSAINSDLNRKRRYRPRPSSVHPSVVNVFFLDGHGRSLSESIDPLVFAKLVTSGGEKYGQEALDDSSF